MVIVIGHGLCDTSRHWVALLGPSSDGHRHRAVTVQWRPACGGPAQCSPGQPLQQPCRGPLHCWIGLRRRWPRTEDAGTAAARSRRALRIRVATGLAYRDRLWANRAGSLTQPLGAAPGVHQQKRAAISGQGPPDLPPRLWVCVP